MEKLIKAVPALLARGVGEPDVKRDVGFTATAVCRLADGDVGKGIVRLHNGRIDRKTAGRAGFRRREAVVLVNASEPDHWTLAVALGAGRSVEGLTRDAVAIDYDQKEALGLRGSEPIELLVRPARHREVFAYYWDHPDPGMALATRLGALGVALGFVGGVLGLLGLAIAL